MTRNKRQPDDSRSYRSRDTQPKMNMDRAMVKITIR